jgi:hypothetical protein
MNLIQNAKGQSSVEFVSLSGVMFFVLIGMLIVLQNRLAGMYMNRIYQSSDSLGDMISSEIRLAESSQGTYSREFYLPYELAGYNYSISLSSPTEIVIKIENIDHVVFLDRNISGTIGKGRNVITKYNGMIFITSLAEHN